MYTTRLASRRASLTAGQVAFGEYSSVTSGVYVRARVAALRADPANPLTWHHVEFDNVLLLVPRSIHEAAQHAGGYARQ